MTPDQFQALAQLLRLRAGLAQDAARMVLVDGVSQADAARATGLTPQAVHNAVKRVQTGHELALVVAKQ
jgi:DNA-directed RNA polymerase specialized sigma24 family protein